MNLLTFKSLTITLKMHNDLMYVDAYNCFKLAWKKFFCIESLGGGGAPLYHKAYCYKEWIRWSEFES